LQRDSACGETSLLVLNRVTGRERNSDGWIVRGMTERGVAEQRIDESISGRWAGARNALLLAVGLNGAEALCADGLLVGHRAEVRCKFCNQFTGQRFSVVVRRCGRR